MRFVGVDIESTRGDLYGRAIQLGWAFSKSEYYSTPLRWTPQELEHHGMWQDEAAAVHQIPKEQCLFDPQHNSHASAVDRMLGEQYQDVPEKELIAVGFNVAGFDMAILRRDMPKFCRPFHYRTLDINAVLFMDGLRAGTPPLFKERKDTIMDEAKRRLTELGIAEKRHDAGYDALFALVCMEVLQEWRAPA